jgi:hypothetical protein
MRFPTPPMKLPFVGQATALECGGTANALRRARTKWAPGVDDMRSYCFSMAYEAERVVFQAHPLRHSPSRKHSLRESGVGFCRFFRGLCGLGCSPAPAPGGPEAFSRAIFSGPVACADLVNSFPTD